MRKNILLIVTLSLTAAVAGAPAARADAADSPSSPPADDAALSLEDVTRAALETQPLLAAQSAQIEVYRHQAVAAGELPDPQLVTGISELPVNTADAWSLDRDGDTDLMVGFVQEFPRAAKRRLRRSSLQRQALSAREELADTERRVRREAGLAFLDRLLAERSAVLARAQVFEAEALLAASATALRAGALDQDEALAASVELENLRDAELEARQQAASARERLRRWIGDLADRDVSMELPVLPELRLPADHTEHLEQHPALRALDQREAVARTELELAKAAYKPDWRIEVGYGYRPAFSEMLSVRFSIDLPLFTRNRQGRGVAAAHQALRRVTALREDELRHHVAESAALLLIWQSNTQRAEQYAAAALPAARARAEAATAAFRAARQPLTSVFDAQAALLDVELRALQLQIDALRSRLEVDYFLAEEPR